MKQLFVGANAAYTSVATPNLLTAGQVGIFSADTNALITVANVDDYKGKPFYIASHSAMGPRIGNPIHKITNLRLNAYAAPVKQVTTISGLALASPATKFDEYSVKVIDVSKGTSPSENRITYNAVGVFGNVAAMVDRLVAVINGNSNSVVVASRSTNDLVLTAKEFDVRFRVAVQGKIENATVTYGTAWSPGAGYGPRLLEIEKDYLAYEGVLNRIDARYPQPIFAINPASNYETIVLDGVYTANQKAGTDALYNRNLHNLIAVVDGGAQIDTIFAILGELQSQVGPQGEPGV